LEKKQFELQQLELERQKQSLQQSLVLKLQQNQLEISQELQQLQHHYCNDQNNSCHIGINDDNTRHHPQQPEEQQQQQGSNSDDYHQKQQQQQHHGTQQQQDSSDILFDGYAAYTTTLAEMEDTCAVKTDLSSNSNNNNDKRRACARIQGSEHSLGNVTKMLKGSRTDPGSDDEGNDTHDKSFDNISTMMLSMNDLSVKDDELQDSHSNLGIIDGLSDDMVGGFLATSLMSAISIMSMTNNSMDSLFRSNRVDSSTSSEAYQNASWDSATATGSSSDYVGTPKLGSSIAALLVSDLRKSSVSSKPAQDKVIAAPRCSSGDIYHHGGEGNGGPTRQYNSSDSEHGYDDFMGEGSFDEAKVLRMLAAGVKVDNNGNNFINGNTNKDMFSSTATVTCH